MNPDFGQIKAGTDLVRVVEGYGIALRKVGQDHIGLCPFHEDHTPSLRVTQSKGLFRCPSCNTAGNVIQFVARMEHLTEREAALKLLCAVPGVQRGCDLPTPPPPPKEKPTVEVPPEVAAKLLARVAGYYAKALYKERAGLDYLKGRGLDDPALLETFGVGYCDGSIRSLLPKQGEIVEQLKALGLLNDKGNETFYGRVTVPIHDTAGNVAGLYGRHTGDGEPRHLYLKGPRRGVFNGATAKAHQSLILVESIIDAMSLWAAGFRNAVALYGADGWTEHHTALIRENDTQEIYLALDNDQPGHEGAAKLRPILAELGVTVHDIAWPEDIKDANAFFSSRPASDFEGLLKSANPATTQESETKRLEKESVEPRATADGFTAAYGEGAAARRYELCAVEKPSASRLKATVKAIAREPGRFVLDTVDFFSLRSKRAFISEAARLYRESVDVIEGDVNRLTLAAECYLAEKQAGTLPETAATVSSADRAEGMRLGRCPGLIGEIQRDLDRLGIVGETTNRLMLYLAMVSRKTEEPLAVQILSSSGAGKSHLQDAVLSLCPPEDLIKLTSLTDRALFYKGEDSLRHKAIAIAEVAGADGARYALRNLISEKKLVIESTVKNPLTGKLETQVNTVYGPTAVFETTTQPDTDPETKSRYLLLSVDESPAQTRAIVEAQRQSHTLEGRKRKRQRDAILARHHAFQRMLRPVVVVNPFEPLLGYSDDAGAGRLTQRRDHPKYLNLILTVTFLHQLQRPIKHDAELGDYIETTMEDIAAAHELAAQLFGQDLDDISFPSRDLLRLTGEYVAGRARACGKPALEIEWTRRELREAIHWTEARLRLHLGELVRLEYLAPVGGRFGSRFRYRLLIEPERIAEGGRLVVGWKPVEQLRREANLAGIGPNLASVNGNLAATSQPVPCEVPTVGEPHEQDFEEEKAANLASRNGKRIYVLKPVNGNGAGISVTAEAATAGKGR